MNIQELIAKGKIEEALSHLGNSTEVLMQKAAYTRGSKDYSLGLIDFGDWAKIQAKITYAILEIASKNNITVNQNVTINLINCNIKDFSSAISQLDFDELYPLVMKSFKDEPSLLSQVYDILEPINRRSGTGQMLIPGSVGEAKEKLIQIYSAYLDHKNHSKKTEQRGDLDAILAILTDESSEDDLMDCFELLELFLVSNTNFHGLDELRSRKTRLTDGPSERVLRKANRLGARIKEERTWVVNVVNRIIKTLEK